MRGAAHWKKVTVLGVATFAIAGLMAVGHATRMQQAPREGFNFGEKKPPIPWNGKRRTAAATKNMRQVGWTDLNGHPDAEQLHGTVVNGRDYIYYGHYWSQGISIVDVTDPAKPEVVGFLQTPEPFTKSTKVQIAGTILQVPVRPLSELDKRPPPRPTWGVNYYDISDPRNPKHLSYFQTATTKDDKTLTDGVHYSSFYPSGYAYLAAPVNGYRGNIFMIVDVRDPKNPKEAGRWWAPGQHVAGGEQFIQGVTPTLHGAQATRDETIGFFPTLGDPPGGIFLLDIRDKAKPKMLSRLDLSPPMVDGYFGVHSVVTLDSRKLFVCEIEGTGNPLTKGQQTGWVVDYSNPAKPVILSVLPIPPGHDRTIPARFGPHNAHENHPNGLIDDYMLYISWFNGGVRVFDLSDPKYPEEVGYFEPPDPKYRMDARTWSGKPGDPNGSELASFNHVYVDKRGYIYTSGYNDGMYILEYTGPRPAGSRTALEEARRKHAKLAEH